MPDKKTQLRYTAKQGNEELVKMSKLLQEPPRTESQKKIDLLRAEALDKVLRAKAQGYDVDLICDGEIIGTI